MLLGKTPRELSAESSSGAARELLVIALKELLALKVLWSS